MNRPVCETKDSLLGWVERMHTKGSTALGPGLLTAVAMASKGAPGSQVIVLTDGEANCGIGSFNGYGVPEGSAVQFYRRVGTFAEE